MIPLGRRAPRNDLYAFGAHLAREQIAHVLVIADGKGQPEIVHARSAVGRREFRAMVGFPD